MKGDDPLSSWLDDLVDEVRAGIGFLTRVPARWIGLDPTARPDFRQAARMFPLVGALIGLAGAAVMVVAQFGGLAPLVAATLAVTTTMALTGGLHEDGLADTADSFGGRTTEQRLEIMDDSRIGTYGAAALVLTLLLRVGTLAALGTAGIWIAAIVLIAAEGASRAAMVRVWQDLPAARMGGLSQETGPPDQAAMLVALATGIGLTVLTIPAIGLRGAVLAGVLAALATYGATRLVARALGGRTGDTLGASQQAALCAFLIGAAAG